MNRQKTVEKQLRRALGELSPESNSKAEVDSEEKLEE
jgi:hypothetical protein